MNISLIKWLIQSIYWNIFVSITLFLVYIEHIIFTSIRALYVLNMKIANKQQGGDQRFAFH